MWYCPFHKSIPCLSFISVPFVSHGGTIFFYLVRICCRLLVPCPSIGILWYVKFSFPMVKYIFSIFHCLYFRSLIIFSVQYVLLSFGKIIHRHLSYSIQPSTFMISLCWKYLFILHRNRALSLFSRSFGNFCWNRVFIVIIDTFVIFPYVLCCWLNMLWVCIWIFLQGPYRTVLPMMVCLIVLGVYTPEVIMPIAGFSCVERPWFVDLMVNTLRHRITKIHFCLTYGRVLVWGWGCPKLKSHS